MPVRMLGCGELLSATVTRLETHRFIRGVYLSALRGLGQHLDFVQICTFGLDQRNNLRRVGICRFYR